jgi:acetyl-CoA synthetase
MYISRQFTCTLVFGGFSAEALADRIIDAQCKILITADEGERGGRIIPLKKIASEALTRCHSINKVLVLKVTLYKYILDTNYFIS